MADGLTELHNLFSNHDEKESSINHKQQLMSPDDVCIDDDEAYFINRPMRRKKKKLNLGKRTKIQPVAAPVTDIEPPPIELFRPETINPEQLALGQQAFCAIVEREDKHGRTRNTILAYEPKINKYRRYCELFFSHDMQVVYQVTKLKVEQYLSYCFYREAKPRGRKKGQGGARGTVYIDEACAKLILRVFQNVKVGFETYF